MDDIQISEQEYMKLKQEQVENTKKKSYGTSPTYVANGLIMDYVELNTCSLKKIEYLKLER